MARGRLQVFLGAAPGVGKTYAALEEVHRLRAQGTDVVVALVETHDRPATAALLDGLEVVPRRAVVHRGVALTELDVGAVLARAPQVAFVDEYAHTNAPGSERGHRWEDVDALQDAGIDVITTVNIQHIASLNDVVERITGLVQRETVPDAVLRRADTIEVVDLAPEALRQRLAAGRVYPSERVDAALANYFRLGNLTALRELALLWLADEVDQALRSYRAAHGIRSGWEARERVVVAVPGGSVGETLLRRGARIAARAAGGELHAVHITSDDGLAVADPAALVEQRALVAQLGGSYHQIVGTDVAEALVQFARSQDATQLVIGVSRRGRIASLLGPGVGATVIAKAGDIDVHIVSHGRSGHRLALPRLGGALSVRRRILGFVIAVFGGPALTALLWATRGPDALTAQALAYQLLVVVVALVGGILPAAFAAVLSGMTLDLLFVEPIFTLTIGRPTHLIALLLYLVSGLLVSMVVDQAARRSRLAARSAAEADVVATVAGGVLLGEDAVEALVARTREAFDLDSVRLLHGDVVLAEACAPAPDSEQADSVSGQGQADSPSGRGQARTPTTELEIGDRAVLVLQGHDLSAADQRTLRVITTQLAAALEHRDLVAAADELKPLAEADRVRSALLAAVGHDLRRPLAVATAAVTGLRSHAVHLSEEDRAALLESAETGLTALDGLITNLLDVSRVQAGALAVSLTRVDLDDLLPAVLEELGVAPGEVRLTVPAELPPVMADPVLLQRVLVNVLANALRFSPPDRPPELRAAEFGDLLDLRVIDRGPGVSDARKPDLFVPFQRLGDTDNTTGTGLGLAIVHGFVAGMAGTVEAEDTPGGGLTIAIALPLARAQAADRPAEAATR